MAYSIILISHIIAGVLGVLLGPVAIAGLARGRAGWVASAYHLAVALVCLSAVGLAVLDFAALWWFVLVSAASYAFAVRGLLAIRTRQLGWVARAVRGFGGAYIALWTAILVVSVPALPVVWLLPTVLGVPVLEWFVGRLRSRPEPSVSPAAPA